MGGRVLSFLPRAEALGAAAFAAEKWKLLAPPTVRCLGISPGPKRRSNAY